MVSLTWADDGDTSTDPLQGFGAASQTGRILTDMVEAVPEPSTWCLAGAACLVMLGRSFVRKLRGAASKAA